MVYTGTYIDENGVGHEISLTEEDSIEALKNDRDALLRRYNTQRVTVRQVKAQEGEAMRFQLTLHAPTHYLTLFVKCSVQFSQYISLWSHIGSIPF